MFGKPKPLGPALSFTPEQLAVTHDGMFRVVNGSGTGARAGSTCRRHQDGRQDRHRAGRGG